MCERAAGLVVFRKLAGKLEYLLLQASYKPYHWTPPKGHVDPGEDEWTAALRETEEEAGLKENQLNIYKDCHETLSYQVKKRGGRPGEMINKTTKYWLAGLKNPEDVKLSDEHQKSTWAELENAIIIAEYEEMAHLFRKCDSYLRTNNLA